MPEARPPESDGLTLSADLLPGDREAVVDGLVRHNVAHGSSPSWRDLNLVLRDAAGAVRGGALGETNAGWCFLKALWADESLRGRGCGRRLLAAVEDGARARGCLGVYLDTYSFQARPFYERAGYAVFGTLPDHPPGGAKYYLAKRFDGGRGAGAAESAVGRAADPSADPSCVFCRIAAGAARAHVVWADAEHVAFLDRAPIAAGHVLLVPRRHVAAVADLDADAYARLFLRARALAGPVAAAAGAPRAGIAVEGFGVDHAHVHLVPVWRGGDLDPCRRAPADADALGAAADRLAAALGAAGLVPPSA